MQVNCKQNYNEEWREVSKMSIAGEKIKLKSEKAIHKRNREKRRKRKERTGGWNCVYASDRRCRRAKRIAANATGIAAVVAGWGRGGIGSQHCWTAICVSWAEHRAGTPRSRRAPPSEHTHIAAARRTRENSLNKDAEKSACRLMHM